MIQSLKTGAIHVTCFSRFVEIWCADKLLKINVKEIITLKKFHLTKFE